MGGGTASSPVEARSVTSPRLESRALLVRAIGGCHRTDNDLIPPRRNHGAGGRTAIVAAGPGTPGHDRPRLVDVGAVARTPDGWLPGPLPRGLGVDTFWTQFARCGGCRPGCGGRVSRSAEPPDDPETASSGVGLNSQGGSAGSNPVGATPVLPLVRAVLARGFCCARGAGWDYSTQTQHTSCKRPRFRTSPERFGEPSQKPPGRCCGRIGAATGR